MVFPIYDLNFWTFYIHPFAFCSFRHSSTVRASTILETCVYNRALKHCWCKIWNKAPNEIYCLVSMFRDYLLTYCFEPCNSFFPRSCSKHPRSNRISWLGNGMIVAELLVCLLLPLPLFSWTVRLDLKFAYPGWPDMQIILCTINCHTKKTAYGNAISFLFSMVIVWKVCQP